MNSRSEKAIPLHVLAGRTVVQLRELRQLQAARESREPVDIQTFVEHVTTAEERSEAVERLLRLRRRVA